MTEKLTCWSCGTVFVDVGKQPVACPRCATVVGATPAFPPTLLAGVRWKLSAKKPASEAVLREAVERYNDRAIDLFDVTLLTRRVRVSYRFEPAVVVEPATPVTAIGLLFAVQGTVAKRLCRLDHTVYEFCGFNYTVWGSGSSLPPQYVIQLGDRLASD